MSHNARFTNTSNKSSALLGPNGSSPHATGANIRTNARDTPTLPSVFVSMAQDMRAQSIVPSSKFRNRSTDENSASRALGGLNTTPISSTLMSARDIQLRTQNRQALLHSYRLNDKLRPSQPQYDDNRSSITDSISRLQPANHLDTTTLSKFSIPATVSSTGKKQLNQSVSLLSDTNRRFNSNEARVGVTALLSRIIGALKSSDYNNHNRKSSTGVTTFLDLVSNGQMWHHDDRIGDDGISALCSFLEATPSSANGIHVRIGFPYQDLTDAAVQSLLTTLEKLVKNGLFIIIHIDLSGSSVSTLTMERLSNFVSTLGCDTLKSMILKNLDVFQNTEEVEATFEGESYQKNISVAEAWKLMARSLLLVRGLEYVDLSFTDEVEEEDIPERNGRREEKSDSYQGAVSQTGMFSFNSYIPRHIVSKLLSHCAMTQARSVATLSVYSLHYSLLLKSLEAASHTKLFQISKNFSRSLQTKSCDLKGSVDIAALISKVSEFAGVDTEKNSSCLRECIMRKSQSSSRTTLRNIQSMPTPAAKIIASRLGDALDTHSPSIRALCQSGLSRRNTPNFPMCNYGLRVLNDIIRNPDLCRRILAFLTMDEQYSVLPKLNYNWCELFSTEKFILDAIPKDSKVIENAKPVGHRPKLLSCVFESAVPPRNMFTGEKEAVNAWSGASLRNRLIRLAPYLQRLEFRSRCCQNFTKDLNMLDASSKSECKDLQNIPKGEEVLQFLLDSASSISKCTTLQLLEIDFSGLPLTSNMALDLISRHCTHLRSLNISGLNLLSHTGLIKVARECISLQTLIARSMSNITSRGFSLMFDALFTSASRSFPVRGMDFSWCPLFDDSALNALASKSSFLHKLRALSLAGTSVTLLQAYKAVISVAKAARALGREAEMRLLNLRSIPPAEVLAEDGKLANQELAALEELKSYLPNLRIYLDSAD